MNSDGTGEELYLLTNDPYETTNVVADHPQVSAKLKEKAVDWFKALPLLADEQVAVGTP